MGKFTIVAAALGKAAFDGKSMADQSTLLKPVKPSGLGLKWEINDEFDEIWTSPGKAEGVSNTVSWHQQFWSSEKAHTSGAIVVKDFACHDYFAFSGQSISMTKAEAIHAETVLFEAFRDKTKNFASLPSKAKIIAYCRYSPCKKCMEFAVAEFLYDLFEAGAKTKKVFQVSFVFDKYYVANSHTESWHHLFKSPKEADDWYYGCRRWAYESYGDVEINGKKRYRLTFRQLNGEGDGFYSPKQVSTKVPVLFKK